MEDLGENIFICRVLHSLTNLILSVVLDVFVVYRKQVPETRTPTKSIRGRKKK